MESLENGCVIRNTGRPAPPEDTADPVTEWKRIRELFAGELKEIRRSLPVKSRLLSRTRIEPVKYSEDREVLLLRTLAENPDGTYSGGAVILDLETAEIFYGNPALFRGRDSGPGRENRACGLLDLNRAGWLLLIGDGDSLRLYDIADRTETVLPEKGPFSFAAFPEDDRVVLCRKGNTVYVFSTESGKCCGKLEFPGEYDRMYLTGGNTFALARGDTAVQYVIEPAASADPAR